MNNSMNAFFYILALVLSEYESCVRVPRESNIRD